jgi:sortase A
MSVYCYLKKEPKVFKTYPKKFIGYFSFGLFFLGAIFLANAFWPIINYEVKSRHFTQQLISPVSVLGESTTVIDYSQPKTWFPTAPSLPPKPSKITHYTLTIPKLKIDQAVVQIGGDDLMESLVQYPGTSLPGQYGNAVVFGHSVLPQFFNPKNYKTIFSTLPTLKENDEIFIDFDGILYRYEVIGLREVSQEDATVLEQHYDGEYLSLITCVPPGTYLRRLVVTAKLTRI